MTIFNQCCAPRESVRCQASNIGKSDHCEEHAKLYQPLYLMYKKATNRAYAFNPINATGQQLLKWYADLTNAYHLRREHLLSAYVPELHCVGHKQQFTILNTMIEKCELLMAQKFNITDTLSDTSNDTSDDAEEDEEKEESVTSSLAIKRFHRRRRNDRRYDEIILNAFIEANQELLIKRQVYIDSITDVLRKMISLSWKIEPTDFHIMYFLHVIRCCESTFFYGKNWKPCIEKSCTKMHGVIVPSMCPCIRIATTIVYFTKKCSFYELKMLDAFIHEFLGKVARLVNMFSSYVKTYGDEALEISYELNMLENGEIELLENTNIPKRHRQNKKKR